MLTRETDQKGQRLPARIAKAVLCATEGVLHTWYDSLSMIHNNCKQAYKSSSGSNCPQPSPRSFFLTMQTGQTKKLAPQSKRQKSQWPPSMRLRRAQVKSGAVCSGSMNMNLFDPSLACVASRGP